MTQSSPKAGEEETGEPFLGEDGVSIPAAVVCSQHDMLFKRFSVLFTLNT